MKGTGYKKIAITREADEGYPCNGLDVLSFPLEPMLCSGSKPPYLSARMATWSLEV
ncbi:MAG: hypothetical protein UR90_C0016G0011 [Parcubacteria group bacterium GW2011_GWC1_35_8]|uniref:Uncharacterized protein n=1 Tax=Candidatus Nomurabacteria bacterium GW2011_GWC2_35_8 TaxID=1618752 RepID=A0A0G0FLV4_9BACT|nr:MAG: hypothetical protein UR90_C0016G0011 [Parcubacteria group bacterium GW2011_GWC1_35_8]KKP88400.1 MAG: hypothetical protein UR91_C0019G0005 [Candidatus Nomurabacteria bacterium GW2011_GWC2_35_8]